MEKERVRNHFEYEFKLILQKCQCWYFILFVPLRRMKQELWSWKSIDSYVTSLYHQEHCWLPLENYQVLRSWLILRLLSQRILIRQILYKSASCTTQKKAENKVFFKNQHISLVKVVTYGIFKSVLHAMLNNKKSILCLS